MVLDPRGLFEIEGLAEPGAVSMVSLVTELERFNPMTGDMRLTGYRRYEPREKRSAHPFSAQPSST